MKKQRKEPFEAIPVDGWVKLKPQEWVVLHRDQPPARDAASLASTMVSIRGAILASCFSIEQALIVLELAEIYGSSADECSALPGYAERDRARRSENSLGRKIDKARDIYRKHLPKADADSTIQRMAEFRDLRNLMAHYACWLEPVNDEIQRRTVDFTLCIGDQSHIWTIDNAQTKRWNALIIEIIRDATRLTFRLKGAPEPTFVEGSYMISTSLAPEPNKNRAAISVGSSTVVAQLPAQPQAPPAAAAQTDLTQSD